MKHLSTRLRGVSLIEILVVVAIIALLIGLFIPSLMRAKRATKRTVCMAYARQIGGAATRRNIRMQIEALDCGCYGDLNKELGEFAGSFRLPDGMDEDAFRAKLEADLAAAKD